MPLSNVLINKSKLSVKYMNSTENLIITLLMISRVQSTAVDFCVPPAWRAAYEIACPK